MYYTHTSLSVDTSIDVISKYQQLIESAADKDSLYIRAREVCRAMKESNMINSATEATIISQILTQLSGAIASGAMQTALSWANYEREFSRSTK